MADNFISSVSSKEFDKALLGGLDAANGKFAKTEDIPPVPTKLSELENDAGYLKSFTEADPTVPTWAKTPEKPEYTAQEVGARPDSWTPSAADVGADPAGTADAAVSDHNVDADAHNDIRLLIEGLASRLNALADSDDTTLDQMSEIVAYIKANKTLIDSITTNKVNVSDIINNLTTNVSNKPLSAAQGVILKGLIDSLSTGKLDVTAIADWAKAATKPSYTKNEVGLGNVDNVKQYSASNPPPYPVTSVNGATGAVTVTVPEIVQETGDSESAVMSQKAVTDALNGYVIPDYWHDFLESKCDTIKALQDAGGKDCFSFVVMADLHYPSNLGKRSPDLAKKILEDCDIKFALCLGDVQTRGCHATKELLLAENVKIEEMLKPIRKSLLQTQGNHDGNYGWLDRDGNGEYNNTDSDGNLKPEEEKETYVYSLTPGELHSALYRKVGLVGDCHFDSSGTGYWIDDVSNKVRYIILNTQNTKYELQEDGTAKYPPMWVFRFQQSQFNLTIEALNSIPSDEWAVVVAGHCPLWQEIGDREVMKGVLAAYKAKDTYSGEYAGTAAGGAAYTNLAEPLPDNTTDTTKWVNNYRISSSGISAQNGTTVSNPIACSNGDVIRIKGVTFRDSADRYMIYRTPTGGTPAYNYDYYSNNVTIGGSALLTYDGVENGVYKYTVGSGSFEVHHIRFAMPTPANADDVIITVNEEIVESAHGYDYVSVDCDFSEAKGKLVGYFAGHAHVDANNVQYGAVTDSEHGFQCIATRCDAAEESDETLKAERIAGTTTEQSFDVFTVNKNTGTISATKIGAGDDRTINY